MDLLQTPLKERHAALGAKFAEFGGWEMPLEYADGGVLSEHAAVRDAVGLFDVSHLGKALVRGPGALDFINGCLANDLRKIGPGQAQYQLCCDENGGTVDDLIAYVRSDDEVFIMPNAANTAGVLKHLTDAAPSDITVTGQHLDYAVLALQGPRSADVLRNINVEAGHPYMSFVTADIAGQQVTVCRTGYTGERGYELVVPTDGAVAVWDAIIEAGKDVGLKAAGLGARDTLRTEMGYPLHGHELSDKISPVMARANWAVGWDKPEFWGKAALTKQREEKTVPLLRGILATGRGIPRPGMTVLDGNGNAVGEVTSGTFSPTLRQGIGIALLDRSVKIDDEVSVDVRGRSQTFKVVKPPFVEPSTKDDD